MTPSPSAGPAFPGGAFTILRRIVLRPLLMLLMPALFVGGLYAFVTDLPSEIRAARGAGRPGNLVIVSEIRGKSHTWDGRFTSDDHAVVDKPVGYEGQPPDGTKVGDTIRARYTGGLEAHAPKAGAGEWWSLIAEAVVLLFGAWFAFVYWIRLTWPAYWRVKSWSAPTGPVPGGPPDR